MSTPYRVTVVCTGNICRSPMGELLLRERLEAEGLADRVEVDSAGTTAWEEGNPADPRTLDVLRRHGHTVDGSQHRAAVIDRARLAEADLVLAADRGHLSTLRRQLRAGGADRVRLIRSFDPGLTGEADQEMADPWYGDDASFEQTYAEMVASLDGIVEHIRASLPD